MNKQQFNLANNEAYERLQIIFEEIQDEILRGDEDIINELDPIIEELEDQDKLILFKHLRTAFPDHTFWKIEKFKIEQQSEAKVIINYKEIYDKELKIDRNWLNFLNFLKIKEFCEQNNIPEILYNKDSLVIMQKLQDKSFLLFELNELILEQMQKPQQFIQCLVPFIFNDNILTDLEQNCLEQIIGNLLSTKIYEFIELKDSIFSNKNEELLYISNVIQNCQLKNINFEEIIKDQKINYQQLQFIKLICIQDIKDPSQNLNNFLCNLLNIREEQKIQKIITKNQIINQFDQIALKNIFLYEECYFRILFYFWIQYFNKLNQQNEIKLLEDDLKKVKPERKLAVLNRYLTKVKKITNDELHLFIIHNLIYFQADSSLFIYKEQYEQYKTESNNYLKNAVQYSCLSVQSFLEKDLQQFRIGIKQIRNLSLQIFQSIFIKNEYFKFYQLLYFAKIKDEEESYNYLRPLFSKTKQTPFLILLEQIEKCIQIFKSYEIIIILNLVGKYKQIQEKALSEYRISYLIFQNFHFAQILKYIKDIEVQKQSYLCQTNTIQYLYGIKKSEWIAIRLFVGNEKLVQISQQLLNQYLDFYRTDNHQMFFILSKIIPIIKTRDNQKINLLKLLFKIFFRKKKFASLQLTLLNSLIKKNATKVTLSEYQATLYIIFKLVKINNLNMREFLLSNLQKIFKNQAYDLTLIKQELGRNTPIKLLIKVLYIQFLLNSNSSNKPDNIFEECENLYNLDSQFYERWFSCQKVNQNFKFSPYFISRYRQYEQLPKNAAVSLQDFNISLSEMSADVKIKLIKYWITSMNDNQMFKTLIPFFFNIIKRQEDPREFLQLVNNELETQQTKHFKNGFNMKALFQILYNNSDYELKVMLIKFQCKLHPVPFLFQNQELQDVKDQQDIYKLNEKLFYVFPKSLPIINLSLSEKQIPIGKTKLINQIFYQMDKFETLDMCEINRNTIDIMFDFSFSGSRQFSVADVHGFIPIPILRKLLQFFKIWIIQLNSEEELIDTFGSIQSLTKDLQIQQLPLFCLVIRNSTEPFDKIKSNPLYAHIFKEIPDAHCITDLTKNNLSKTQYETEIERFQKFIYGKIDLLLKEGNKYQVTQENYLQTIKNFNTSYRTLSQEIEQDGEIMQKLQEELKKQIDSPSGFYNINSFPLRSIEWQIKNLKDELNNLMSSQNSKNNQRIQEINLEVSQLENQISQQKPTQLLNLFCDIFKQNNSYILYLSFTEKIRQFNEINTYEIQDKIQILNEKLQKLKQERNALKKGNEQQQQQYQFSDEALAIKQKIKLINDELSMNLKNMSLKNIGIELFWRELIQMKQKCISFKLPINPIDIVYEMIKKGEPFEFLDGDQLKIDQKFLKELTDKFSQQGNERVLVLSVLGPQSSGKSTILNQIFGCHFWTSVGRCTKGIYLQLLRIQQKEYFDDLFDYILILDSEGLQNPNQLDPEFDKKIALFILAISDIILINVKGDIHSQFKNLVEMCIFTLGQMQKAVSSIKSLSWCFNQNGDVNNFAPFLHQIQGIANSLNQEFNKTDNDNDNQNIDYNEILDIKKENIKILGFASTEKSWKNISQSLSSNWRQIVVNETFSEEAYEYGVRIIKNFVQKKKISVAEANNMQSLHSFIQNIDTNWQTICRLPDLLEFTELIQYKQDELMKNNFETIYEQQSFDFIKYIDGEINDNLHSIKNKNMELFKDLEVERVNEITQKLEQIKDIVKDQLLKIKQEHQISKKILIKYENRLTERIQTQREECKLTIFNEIKKHETKFQQNNGFLQIDNYISAISENIEELQKLKSNPELIEQNFKIMWSSITDAQLKQMKNIFQDFSLKQFKSISSSFTNYQLQTNREQEYQQYFIKKINKLSPLQNQQAEKEQILQIFRYELNQQQFQMLDGTKNVNIYGDIFGSPILERLQRASDKDVLNINNYYQFQLEYAFINKEDLKVYLQKDFVDDFKVRLEQVKQLSDGKGNKQRNQNPHSLLTQFFNLIFCCQLDFCSELYEKLNQTIKSAPNILMNFFNSHEKQILEAFQKFSEKLIVGDAKIILKDLAFFQEFSSSYKKLKIQNHKILFDDEISLKDYLQKNNNLIIVYHQFIIIPNSQTRNYSLEYIAYQNYDNKQFFTKEFIEYFSNEMNNNSGWNKLYFELYDLIVAEMRSNQQKVNQKNKDQQQDSDEDICSSNINLITLIMSKIKLQIVQFNKQFARFGVVLNMIGERCIYYYSMFLIWRFSCYKQWKTLQNNHDRLLLLRDEQFKKYKAEIDQNKVEQSRLKAKSLAETLYTIYIERYYKENLLQIENFIEAKSRNCFDIIKEFDSKLLEEYQINSSNQIKEEVLKYITAQKEYIEQFANQQISKIQEEIELHHQTQFEKGLFSFLQVLYQNIKLITIQIENQKKEGIKTIEYFERIDDESRKDIEFEQFLFQIVKSCLLGEKKKNPLVNLLKSTYEGVFQYEQFKEIPIKIFLEMKQSTEEEIQLLKPYMEELLQEIQKYMSQCKQQKLNIQKFDIKKSLDKIKLNMIGCLESCPLCKRKCDLPNDNHQKHKCQNGHQLRGMNYVLIENQPSLFTCEEITDDMNITTQETNNIRKWKEIKQMHKDWDFQTITNTNDLSRIKKKMMIVWNGGVGQLICELLSTRFKSQIKFIRKHEFDKQDLERESIHYIFMLDDSGSMAGQAWTNAKCGALQCMQEIEKNPIAKVSVIIFNSDARVVIDCEKVNIQIQRDRIQFQSGGTSFENAFQLAYDQILKHQSHFFSKNIILFYTDGGDSYPIKAMTKFTSLPSNQKKLIQMNVCSEEINPQTLSLMVEEFQKNGLIASLKANIQLGAVQKVWSEVVQKGVHVKD